MKLKADLEINDKGEFKAIFHSAEGIEITQGTISGLMSAIVPAPPPPLPGIVTFWGGFEEVRVTGPGNKNWNHTQISSGSSIELLDTGGRSAGFYAKFSVKDSGSQGSERAEVVHMKDSANRIIFENINSGTISYSFSVKFDPSWKTMVGNNNGAWGIFLQLHGPDSLATNPAFALDASDRIIFSMRTGDIIGNRGRDYELSNGNLNKGQWIDFILTVKYAKDNTGFVSIGRRDQGESIYTAVFHMQNIPTLQYSSNVNGGAVGDHYMKHGLYRNHESFTSVLYLDDFKRIVK